MRSPNNTSAIFGFVVIHTRDFKLTKIYLKLDELKDDLNYNTNMYSVESKRVEKAG